MKKIRLVCAVFVGKCIVLLSQLFRIGAGGTWPGEVALTLEGTILNSLGKKFKRGIIIVAGTNGKTTTSLMIKQILENAGSRVVHNGSGANLINGVVSAILQKVNWLGEIDADWGVFEVDENSLPLVLSSLSEHSESKGFNNGKASTGSANKLLVVLLNLFRDQLDRYGEVDVIADKWKKILSTISDSVFVLNSDDPLIAYIGKISSQKPINNTLIYFGIEDKKQFIEKKEHATDSTFCPNCGTRLLYEGIYFSHLGIWRCTSCGFKRPKPTFFECVSPLPGQYNIYNTLAAIAVGNNLGIKKEYIDSGLKKFKPAFGRQELFNISGKYIKLFLSKNPTGFNASLKTVKDMHLPVLLLALNDRIPDGRDISWIWDVDFEMIPSLVTVIVSGDRVYDLALRIKYAGKKNLVIFQNLEMAIANGLKKIERGETLHILATYSAMLEVRKLITGKKIL